MAADSKKNNDDRDAPGVAARAAAAALLEQVTEHGLFLDAAEARLSERLAALTARDRAFCRRLVLAALRHLGDADAALAKRMNHAPEDPGVRACLRIVATELLTLKSPHHAAVDAAVRVTKSLEPRFSGLVNAVARRIAADASEEHSALEAISAVDWARRNSSAPFWERLAADHGARRAAAIIRAQADGAALDLTPKDRATATALAETLGGEVTPTGSVRLAPSGPVEALEGFDAGAWWVQDAAAALPARMIGAQPGLRIGDFCAAPGGKTMQLAATGAEVVAVDSSSDRLARVRENLARTDLTAEIVGADLRDWRPDRPFDAVLLDAPCTASGTARRHPEALYIKDLSELSRLTRLQDSLMDASWRLIAPGGRLVYCVCSLFAAEGVDRMTAFLERTSDAVIEPVRPDVFAHRIEDVAASSELTTADGVLRTTPAAWRGIGGLDGFFAVRFRKAPPPV